MGHLRSTAPVVVRDQDGDRVVIPVGPSELPDATIEHLKTAKQTRAYFQKGGPITVEVPAARLEPLPQPPKQAALPKTEAPKK